MTSRERVRLALNHEEPDRVPIDNNGIVSSIHEVAYANLLASLGVQEDVVILDAVQRIALNSESVLASLGVDTRYLYPNGPSYWSYSENPDGTWKDEFGTTYRRVGFYADNVDPVLKGKELRGGEGVQVPRSQRPFAVQGPAGEGAGPVLLHGLRPGIGSMLCFDYMRWVLRGLEDAIADLHEDAPGSPSTSSTRSWTG